ncbi:hypothetical protein SAMN05444008_101212 [Cnuella takakiae]|uniref:Uncharacterized protein n=1 Tax=Cnuella takakiae TaxID=1302690 RepID=A0A1M4SRR7_9BACT|nr:hypothetical protein [Cnuella takakiae]OLY90575.1 hypothetical protein BUE76_00620 [Cnuella takakiae]SHE34861.1 hypothetical protein SAMN05444008_101212 [Cnuella takakiae]
MVEVGGPSINPYVHRLYTYIQEAIKDLGSISANLSGSVIREVGLLPAIRNLLALNNPAVTFVSELEEMAYAVLQGKLQLGFTG